MSIEIPLDSADSIIFFFLWFIHIDRVLYEDSKLNNEWNAQSEQDPLVCD